MCPQFASPRWRAPLTMRDQDDRTRVNYRQNAFIARSIGALFIAFGFIIGMYGLDHPESIWLRTALGLIVAGMLAQGYALYCSIQRAREQNTPRND